MHSLVMRSTLASTFLIHLSIDSIETGLEPTPPYLHVRLGKTQHREDGLEQQEVKVRLQKLVRVRQLRSRPYERQARVHHPVRAVLPARSQCQGVHHLIRTMGGRRRRTGSRGITLTNGGPCGGNINVNRVPGSIGTGNRRASRVQHRRMLRSRTSNVIGSIPTSGGGGTMCH